MEDQLVNVYCTYTPTHTPARTHAHKHTPIHTRADAGVDRYVTVTIVIMMNVIV